MYFLDLFHARVGRCHSTKALLCAICWGLLSVANAQTVEQYFSAVVHNKAFEVARMLDGGFDPNTKEETRGDTGLIMAIRENAMDVFDVLVNEPKIDIEATSANGDTALMIACFLANEPAVLTLLKRDAQINRPGWVPLHYAAASGSVEIVKLLLDRSAYIDAASPNATTPLMMAARGGKFDVVKLLVDEGAGTTLKNQQGLDAADFATLGKSTEIAAWLKARPTPSPNQSPTPTPNATPAPAPADKQ